MKCREPLAQAVIGGMIFLHAISSTVARRGMPTTSIPLEPPFLPAIESPLHRFDLRPTAALAEERYRRRLHQASILEDAPDEWFHPQVKSVYATLHTRNDTEAYQHFVRFRHLSRYERQARSGSNWCPDWSGNYSDPTCLITPTATDATDATITATTIPIRNSSRRLAVDVDILQGGQFNHYQGIPLSQGYGTHYVHLWVGSPIPQRQSVIVDTGSHFTAFPCTGCHDCGQQHHTDPYFDPSQSQTFHSLQCPDECQEQATCSSTSSRRCEFTQSYTEGSSWTAYQAIDVLYAGGPDVLEAANPLDRQYSLPFMFGCLQHETGLFITQLADGIMGLSAHETTLPKQLYNQGKLEYNMFAMCFRKELGTSKRGVTAGSMTLGGVSSTLDTTPMVFARNTQPFGWFTVQVQNIFIAKNGGTQFLLDHTASDDFLQSIIKVPIDIAQVNSGKGVIVDSGTTDTYLNANVMPSFVKVWRQVTGMEYTHTPIYLTQGQIQRLPTILIQCQAAAPLALGPLRGTSTSQATTALPDAPIVMGQVGRLDWEHRSDVLLAIPAEHYMEYSPALKLYTSRLYFTETRGGVLGANAMLGKNVLFDWQHSRIGFSQSSCEYDLIDPKEEQVNFASEIYRQGNCVLGKPILTTPCEESVDTSVCYASDRPDNVQVLGTETWTRIVESPGADPLSCQTMATELTGNPKHNQPGEEDSVINCTLNGLCTEYRPCQVPCLEILKGSTSQQPQQKTLPLHKHPYTNSQQDVSENDCGETFWSSCDFDCEQSRLVSKPSPKNGDICVETSRESRECHIDVCGRTDPCVVPFLVHAILVLETKNDDHEWTLKALEHFQQEFTRVSHLPEFSSIAARRALFQEGDVDVLVVRPWREDSSVDDPNHNDVGLAEEAPKSIQLILQVSIANPKVHKVSSPPNNDRMLRQGQDWWENGRQLASWLVHQYFVPYQDNPDAQGTMKRRLTSVESPRELLQEVGVLWQNLTQPFRKPKQAFMCNPSDLYPLAKDAVELANGILEHPKFGSRLIENMPGYTKARVVSSWTIGTQVYDDKVNYYGHIATTPYLFVFRVLYETSVVFFFLSMCSCLLQCFQTYRHWCGALRRRCCGKPPRYLYHPLATRSVDEDGEAFVPTSFSPTSNNSHSHHSLVGSRENPKEIELAYIKTYSDGHKNNHTSPTKRHLSSTPSKSTCDSP